MVQREILNFVSDAPEEEVHVALVGLIRKGALVNTKASTPSKDIDLEPPEWILVPGALESALECQFPSEIPNNPDDTG